MRAAFQVMEKPLAGLSVGARILIDLTILHENIPTSARSEVCLLVHTFTRFTLKPGYRYENWTGVEDRWITTSRESDSGR